MSAPAAPTPDVDRRERVDVVPVPPITRGTVAEVVIVGVTMVGEPLNTTLVVPVEVVTPVPPLATAIVVPFHTPVVMVPMEAREERVVALVRATVPVVLGKVQTLLGVVKSAEVMVPEKVSAPPVAGVKIRVSALASLLVNVNDPLVAASMVSALAKVSVPFTVKAVRVPRDVMAVWAAPVTVAADPETSPVTFPVNPPVAVAVPRAIVPPAKVRVLAE